MIILALRTFALLFFLVLIGLGVQASIVSADHPALSAQIGTFEPIADAFGNLLRNKPSYQEPTPAPATIVFATPDCRPVRH